VRAFYQFLWARYHTRASLLQVTAGLLAPELAVGVVSQPDGAQQAEESTR